MPPDRDLLIGGKEIPAASGRTTADISPWTGEPYARVAAAGPEDVHAAVGAADAAFTGWAALEPFARRNIFLRAADLMEERGEQVVELMAREVGGTRGWALFNVEVAAGMLREAAAAITAPRGDVLTTRKPGGLSLAVREPLGVVAAFAPWNAPVILGTRAVAAPLAAGNTVVVKASEDAPIACGLFVADVLRDAGLPDGVLNVITNDKADAAGIARTLIEDVRVRAVNFTGSTGVGRIIGTLAAEHLKPAVLELGGKNSVIVLEDADLDHAVDAAAFAAFMNSGQICMCADRVLVHASLVDEFNRRFAAKVAELPSGDPRLPGTVIGPLVDRAAAARVAALVTDAVGKGARVVTGGGRPQGALYPATVLTGLPESAELHHTEAFGPVVTLRAFADDDEAVALANDTEHGLSCGILTENGTHGLKVARRIRTGIVHVNDQSVGDEPQAPFGGFADSGYGRFGGRWGIESFSNTRWVTFATEHSRYPF
ncbi:aldehyde dehydrogenase family protein [Streptomyces scabiei]|uniref:aldehyde dehydrogenase family protein n=3 Tax=Streptomyces scabiei TaxID=1930 RepID=UPI000777D1B2|nr:aldehyde dehydrogenase family protein [Streptomyces scabiei]MDX2539612.1 aldehyde dehydrogenase family protein [Streptomyces scabiei]MDX3829813.1 aldehyde dehydrogenase family protein [Streptomyces scabiei]